MSYPSGKFSAASKLFPIILYSTLAYALIMLGFYALFEDRSIVHNICNTEYHFWKYGFLNVWLWVFATVSYCAWKGGGEGARARALVLTIMYFAFFTWGMLLWQRVSDTCVEVMNKQFHTLYVFHHIATAMNGITAFMFLFHEMYLGEYLQVDLTVMATVNTAKQMPGNDSPGRLLQGNDLMAQVGHVGGPGHPMNLQPPPQQPPTNLSPQLSFEYEKIMQNNSSSVLPQTTP